LLPQFLNQENVGEWWCRDEDEVDAAFPNDATSGAGNLRILRHLWIGQKNVSQNPLEEAWLAGGRSSGGLADGRCTSGDQPLDSFLNAEKEDRA
jgi:hypothetical protein